ncbi:MAG: aminotransferase class III-fold pyridoxal phosphate-dependent enzyme, partial [Planctomycetes bacterium]|nr:aminotransferase class III-fold pyridoxal phosphate-dependent enzyme [Planctomycetota bacterium]
FGRVGDAFAATRFAVTPDLICSAKGLTNGCIPMGAVFISNQIHQVFMNGPKNSIELFHGYTYSGHPVACAAGLAALDIYEQENLFHTAHELGDYWQDALHSLRGLPHIIDIRNFGLMGAVELAPRVNEVGQRGFDIAQQCLSDGLLIRCTADTLALSPPLILERTHIDFIIHTIAGAIQQVSDQE